MHHMKYYFEKLNATPIGWPSAIVPVRSRIHRPLFRVARDMVRDILKNHYVSHFYSFFFFLLGCGGGSIRNDPTICTGLTFDRFLYAHPTTSRAVLLAAAHSL